MTTALRKSSMAGHHVPGSPTKEWLTPPAILKALGRFDLDPCASSIRPWPTAGRHFTITDDGLSQDWGRGRVWLNPPYDKDTEPWLRRAASHRNCTALIFARTDTEIWHTWVWNCAHAILFLKGRLFFHRTDGTRARYNGGAPSALVAYDARNAERLINSGLAGRYIEL